jgi:hypothetical protein
VSFSGLQLNYKGHDKKLYKSITTLFLCDDAPDSELKLCEMHFLNTFEDSVAPVE